MFFLASCHFRTLYNDKEPSGIHTVNDGGKPAIDNYLEEIIGWTGMETTTLFQRVNYDVQVTQTPYQINNIKENPDKLYMTNLDENG
ncbi:hypothetical protein [Maribacter arcticus]|uniref:hypothetical protein n=1 Tax=Maribacter arcticus TaxID=561365 RepID=UPI003002FA7D